MAQPGRGEGGAPSPLEALFGDFGEIFWMRTTLYGELNHQILKIIDYLTILLEDINFLIIVKAKLEYRLNFSFSDKEIEMKVNAIIGYRM